MIDIIGNIRIKNLERFKYLLYSLYSLSFLKDSNLHLNIENINSYQKEVVEDLISNIFHNHEIKFIENKHFNEIYLYFLSKCKNNHILHFEEDHFCIIDNVNIFKRLLEINEKYSVDLTRYTYFNIEHESFLNLKCLYIDDLVNIFDHDFEIYQEVNKKMERYYIGVNCIFKKDFALNFWNRDIRSRRPHPFEIPKYEEEFRHIVNIPNIEIFRSIDDDHGSPNSSILNGNHNDKYDSIKKNIYKIYGI